MEQRREKAAAAALVAAVLTAATACGDGSAGDEEGDVTLRFTWWGDPTRHETTEQLADLFEENNPGITIDREPTDFDNYYDALNTKLSADDAPDIINVEIRRLGEYASRGIFADLSGSVDTADLDQELLASGEVDGTLAAIPTGANVWAVLANTAVLEEAGVDLPDDTTWTWEDYFDLSAEISEATDDDTYGTEYAFNPAYLEVFANQRGEQMYEGDQIGVSAETLEEWFGNFETLIDTGGSPDAAFSQEIGQNSVDSSLVTTNNGAFGMWWTNQLNAATEGSGGEVELLRLPSSEGADTGGMFLQPTMYWAASADSEHPEEAAQFIDFLVNDPEAGELLLSDRGLPMNSQVREAISDELGDADTKSLEFVDEVSDELADPPAALPVGAGDVPDILTRYGEEFVFGDTSAAEAAEGFLEEANGALG